MKDSSKARYVPVWQLCELICIHYIRVYSRKDVMYATMEVVVELPDCQVSRKVSVESPYEIMKKQVSMIRKYRTHTLQSNPTAP